MSQVYVPGAFKKKLEDEKLVANKVIPAKVEVKEMKKWVKDKELDVNKLPEKKVEEKPVQYVRQNVYLRRKEFYEWMVENREELEDIYNQFLAYDRRFLDRLEIDENGFTIFCKFIFINFKDRSQLKKM